MLRQCNIPRNGRKFDVFSRFYKIPFVLQSVKSLRKNVLHITAMIACACNPNKPQR
jgi:hypothetical protein